MGLDIGSVNLHGALEMPDGTSHTWVRALRGHLREAVFELLGGEIRPRLDGLTVRVGVTGAGATGLLEAGPVVQINEVAAVVRHVRREVPAARTVIDLGGQYSKWISLDADGEIADFASNGLCAAGSGAFLSQQAGRLDIDLDQLGAFAAQAKKGATVAGRCAVFAKSDMIHHQQKGTQVEEIAYGLCQALVRTFESAVMQGRDLEPKVVLVGGGAANPGLIRAFIEQFGLSAGDIVALEQPFGAGAQGAALCAETAEPLELEELEKLLGDAFSLKSNTPQAHNPPLLRLEGISEPLEVPDLGDAPVSGFLGIDVGSVSTNLVVMDASRRLLEEIYLRTRGRPLDVLAEGLEMIRERFRGRLEILGVGVTGSGRHLAHCVVGGDVVRNEITAQLTSSAHYFPDVDTVFEIGGQDSKYIGIRGGHLAGFEMNKICAAGTGSFLEEQAEGLGISIFDEFAELAFRGEAPCDLGSQCTVFMDAELRRAQQRGAQLPDLCAGLSYSVARNYLERVVGGRTVGENVVFQGGTASNAAVVAAMRRITGQNIVVHPHNRVSGAIGAALLAISEKEQTGYDTSFVGFEACAGASVRVFECKACENRCQVSVVEVGGRRVHFGDICEKFTEADAGRRTESSMRDLFAERARLYEGYVEKAAQKARKRKVRSPLLLPRASVMHELAPFFATWAAELGFEPVLGPPADGAATTLGAQKLPAEMCLPVKIAAGQVRRALDEDPTRPVLAPSIVEMPGQRVGGTRSTTCYFTQGWPQMLGETSGRVLMPEFGLEENATQRLHAAREMSRVLGTQVVQTAAALAKATAAQRRFSKKLETLGAEVLAEDFDKAVVVFGRPYNVHDAFANLAMPRHLRKLGLLAIPYDAMPVNGLQIDERWKTVPWYYTRKIIQVIELMRRDKRLFPIVVSSFGCGVDGFFFKHLTELLSDRPNMLLEFDEHRAEAGLVTRLEAFADEIDEHLRRNRPARSCRTADAGDWPEGVKRVFIPAFGEFSRAYSGAFRLAGFETVVWPQPTEATLRRGESVSSGRECHPFSIMAGQYLEMCEREDAGPDDVIFNVICDVVCLLKQYGDGFRIAQRRLGRSGPTVVDFNNGRILKMIGLGRMLRFYEALVAIEVLFILSRRVRPYALDPEAPIRRYRIAAREIEETLVAEQPIADVLARASREIWEMAELGRPGDRPLVGVTGDMYTRVVDFSNGSLFDRLEQLGAEVWPSPMIGSWSPLADGIDALQAASRLEAKKALSKGTSSFLLGRLYQGLLAAVPEPARDLVREPSVGTLIEQARPYVGDRTSWIIATSVGKCADFLQRGCGGVISAAGVGCMVGTSIAGAIPDLRGDYGGAPVLALAYSGKEGPVQRIRLETFFHQVRQHHLRRGAPE